MDISLIATLVKRLGAVCLAFVILWHVAQHAGPRRGKAIVHVLRPDVVVVVDHREYRVESIAESPVVCELEPGEHVAQVRHGAALLDEQSFTIEPGKDVIVCLPDGRPAHARIATARPASTTSPIPASGLAIDTRRPSPNDIPN